MMSFGVCTIFQGYGAMRGTPAGRQFASGSSFDMCSLVTFSAQGWMGSCSPVWREVDMSYMKVRSGVQIPVKSGLPSIARGVGPAGCAFNFAMEARAVPPPAGSVAASWAESGRGQMQSTTRMDFADITQILFHAKTLRRKEIHSPRAACSRRRAARAGLKTPQEQKRVR